MKFKLTEQEKLEVEAIEGFEEMVKRYQNEINISVNSMPEWWQAERRIIKFLEKFGYKKTTVRTIVENYPNINDGELSWNIWKVINYNESDVKYLYDNGYLDSEVIE